jgi:hypothetical protein
MERVRIKDLRITYEDEWLEKWVSLVGDGVYESPQYLALVGVVTPFDRWMEFRGLSASDRYVGLMGVYSSIKKDGQKEPIKIYKDMRINTGHKRSAALAILGHEYIDAEYVPDDYKL